MDCNGIIYDAVRVHTMSDFKASGAFTKQDMYERAILNHVCDKITEYVAQVKPTNRVFLTFDGVAPVAKLNQQRERRYKTWFTSEMEREFEKPTASAGAGACAVTPVPVMRNEDSWTTACITPGTTFMSKLHERMSEYVDTQKRNKCDASASAALHSHLPDFMLSSSSEPGEGEHKIFEFIRENPVSHRDQTTMVYGLDADLIMLTLNHLHISNGIYLYRETPEFIQSVDARLKPNEQYYMDIPYMAECIARYMTTATITGTSTSTSGGAGAAKCVEIPPAVKKHLVYDYIFMFFMMGNDFMPHFPSMNIRTTGPDTVMNAYKITFQNTLSISNGGTNRSFIRKARDNGDTLATLAIDWASVRDFVQCLSEVEHQNLIAEHTLRDKRARATSSGFRYEPVTTTTTTNTTTTTTNTTTTTGPNNALLHTIGNYGSQCELLLAKCKNATDMLHIPSKERGIEHYIAPVKSGWEQRYYLALFGEKITDRRCQEYCINYLEGLEWTFQYYTRGCVDWRWRYKYAYPPLLADLVRFIPTDTVAAAPTVLLAHKPKDPIQPVDQLRYVLPPAFQSALIPVPVSASVSASVSSPAPVPVPVPVPTLRLTDVRFKWAYCKYFWEAHIVL
jgi:5'-3' exonuclease